MAGFSVKVKIVGKKPFVDGEDTGRADFEITVTFPVTKAGKGGQTIVARCENEEYDFIDGVMEMSPYGHGCTDRFIEQMNAAFV
jgi:hypothetical protein